MFDHYDQHKSRTATRTFTQEPSIKREKANSRTVLPYRTVYTHTHTNNHYFVEKTSIELSLLIALSPVSPSTIHRCVPGSAFLANEALYAVQQST